MGRKLSGQGTWVGDRLDEMVLPGLGGETTMVGWGNREQSKSNIRERVKNRSGEYRRWDRGQLGLTYCQDHWDLLSYSFLSILILYSRHETNLLCSSHFL